jgi:hypothetical protein
MASDQVGPGPITHARVLKIALPNARSDAAIPCSVRRKPAWLGNWGKVEAKADLPP